MDDRYQEVLLIIDKRKERSVVENIGIRSSVKIVCWMMNIHWFKRDSELTQRSLLECLESWLIHGIVHLIISTVSSIYTVPTIATVTHTRHTVLVRSLGSEMSEPIWIPRIRGLKWTSSVCSILITVFWKRLEFKYTRDNAETWIEGLWKDWLTKNVLKKTEEKESEHDDESEMEWVVLGASLEWTLFYLPLEMVILLFIQHFTHHKCIFSDLVRFRYYESKFHKNYMEKHF